MPPAIDLVQKRFGRLVVERLDGHIGRDRAWRCRCDCGQQTRVSAGALRSENTTSCGCLRLERVSTHRLSTSPEYAIWKAARNRCRNPKAQGFENYGGRGIRMCDEWSRSFETFIRDMGRRPSSRHSIDRIDNDGNYEPGNCRWATKIEQLNNIRRNRRVTFNGETLTMTQWARRCRVSTGALESRIELGWPLAEVFTLPANRWTNRHDSRKYTLDGVTRTEAEWARLIGIRAASLRERVDHGWPLALALTSKRVPFDPRRVAAGRAHHT